MFDYTVTAYNKLGKVQEVETVFCSPSSIELYEVMLTMSEQYGHAQLVWYALNGNRVVEGEYTDRD